MRSALSALALLGALVGSGRAQAASAHKTVRTHYDGLVLTLRAHVSGTTVVARATLKNNGPDALQYRAGCSPPEVQIRATDQSGNLVHGYRPPRITCKAITIRTLVPGAHLTVHAHFRIATTVDVRARVPAAIMNALFIETPAITLAPAAA